MAAGMVSMEEADAHLREILAGATSGNNVHDDGPMPATVDELLGDL